MIKKVALFVGILSSLWTLLLYSAQRDGGSAYRLLQTCDKLTSTAKTECIIVASQEADRVANLFLFALIISIISLTIAFWPKKHVSSENYRNPNST